LRFGTHHLYRSNGEAANLSVEDILKDDWEPYSEPIAKMDFCAAVRYAKDNHAVMTRESGTYPLFIKVYEDGGILSFKYSADNLP